ncbi:MAG: manganese efflux pump MntP family protein [Candidatus Eisenbacteria bacterium]|nr:manganese efflux pump MntP family protein [Candidatus Eisenbacteria bacterium]
MDSLTILLTAVGLAMDAFAVSLSSGLTLRCPNCRNASRIAGAFGCFQAVMPVIGWYIGRGFKPLIEGVDHWVAFGLLGLVGIKMIVDALHPEHERYARDPLDTRVLLVLALATSIDALAVGLSFAMLDGSIVLPVIIIGAVTFGMSFAGVMAGGRFGHLLGRRAEVVGGLILIGIGTRILVEHLR